MERRIPWMERGTANPENVLSMDNLAQEQDRPLFYALRPGALAGVATIFSRPSTAGSRHSSGGFLRVFDIKMNPAPVA